MIMKSDYWNVGKNELSISLIDYYVKISINNDLGRLYYSLTVVDSDMRELNLLFRSLEDAVEFTEDKIVHCDTFSEILEFYKDMILNNNNIEVHNKISLTPDEVDQAIIEYFSVGKDNRVYVENTLEMENYCPRILYHLVEYINIDGNLHKVKKLLTEYDLKNALSKYIDLYNYELVSYKCNNLPHYEGIDLVVKEKSNKLKLNK